MINCPVTGIPISRPVGGVACGLVTSGDAEDPDKPDIEQYQLMTDILVIIIIMIITDILVIIINLYSNSAIWQWFRGTLQIFLKC